MNLLQKKLESNVKVVDTINVENIILQCVLRYGIPYTRNVINSTLDLLAEEEKLANIEFEK